MDRVKGTEKRLKNTRRLTTARSQYQPDVWRHGGKNGVMADQWERESWRSHAGRGCGHKGWPVGWADLPKGSVRYSKFRQQRILYKTLSLRKDSHEFLTQPLKSNQVLLTADLMRKDLHETHLCYIFNSWSSFSLSWICKTVFMIMTYASHFNTSF